PDAAGGAWAALLPALLSLTFILSLLTFFTHYATPFGLPRAAVDQPAVAAQLGQIVGVVGILLHAALVTGALLLLATRWTLPFGALTLVLTLNLALLVTSHEQYRFVPVGVLAGIGADLLAARLRPAPERPGALRLFAFAVPAGVVALHFRARALAAGGFAWPVHLWPGTIALAGVAGLLLSSLLVPPPAAPAAGNPS